jgi:hypothetical protein
MIISQLNTFHLLLNTSPITGQGIQTTYKMDWDYTWVEMGMLALVLPLSQSYFVGRLYAVSRHWITLDAAIDLMADAGMMTDSYGARSDGSQQYTGLWFSLVEG